MLQLCSIAEATPAPVAGHGGERAGEQGAVPVLVDAVDVQAGKHLDAVNDEGLRLAVDDRLDGTQILVEGIGAVAAVEA